MSDMAFIGDRDTIWPFKTLGGDVFFSDEHDSPARLFAEILQRQFKLVFVTEDFYDSVRDQIDALREQAIPTFAILPSVKGSRGIALQLIRDSVRKAMGAEFI